MNLVTIVSKMEKVTNNMFVIELAGSFAFFVVVYCL